MARVAAACPRGRTESGSNARAGEDVTLTSAPAATWADKLPPLPQIRSLASTCASQLTTDSCLACRSAQGARRHRALRRSLRPRARATGAAGTAGGGYLSGSARASARAGRIESASAVDRSDGGCRQRAGQRQGSAGRVATVSRHQRRESVGNDARARVCARARVSACRWRTHAVRAVASARAERRVRRSRSWVGTNSVIFLRIRTL